MPVVAVGFAVALDVGAAGALAAGTLTTLAAVTAIGATVSAVGAVTGNKTLSLVGAGLGIVGAIGTLASGAGIFDNVSDLFGSSSMSAADTATLASNAESGMNEALAGLPGAASAETAAAPGIINTAGAIDQGALSPAAAESSSLAPAEGNAAAIETGGQTGAPLAQSLQSAPGAATSSAGAVSPDAATAFSNEVNAPGNDAWSTAINAAGKTDFGDAPPSGLMAWANKNPLLAFGAIQAGGSFISGLTNPMTPAQIDALNAQAEQNRAATALLQKQAANIGQPLPSAMPSTAPAQSAPIITGAPANTGGLINNRPIATPQITGIPATVTGTA